uniref:NADH dehydrogenase subunit 3 n=1 Tax=Discus perspectivus TaxID=697275 RepID=UPI002176D465|nr:NADH dehydrogenase subunit 3 [Discus perspectivus]UUB71744.1 NADH dehydrogenase subunit 3 [Discus perspectivus]
MFSVLLGTAGVISLFFLGAAYFLGEAPPPSSEKKTAFECGFDPLGAVRMSFSVRFYILIVLFLVFDVEVCLLFPLISKILGSMNPFLMWAFFLFIFTLLSGLLVEYNQGKIDWVSL